MSQRILLLARLGCQAIRGNHRKADTTPLFFTMPVRTLYNKYNPGITSPRSGEEETDEQFDDRMVKYFDRPDIDGWEIRKGINDMQTMDMIPEPKIIIAALKACRRVNDHSLAVRYLEAIKFKTGGRQHVWDYLMEEIRPTLNELGISTLDEMGYDEPELALGDPFRTPFIEVNPIKKLF